MVSLRSGRQVSSQSPRARVIRKRKVQSKVQSPRAPSPSRIPIPSFLLQGSSPTRRPSVVKRRKAAKGTKRVKPAVRKPSPKSTLSPGFLARIYAMNH